MHVDLSIVKNFWVILAAQYPLPLANSNLYFFLRKPFVSSVLGETSFQNHLLSMGEKESTDMLHSTHWLNSVNSEISNLLRGYKFSIKSWLIVSEKWLWTSYRTPYIFIFVSPPELLQGSPAPQTFHPFRTLTFSWPVSLSCLPSRFLTNVPTLLSLVYSYS